MRNQWFIWLLVAGVGIFVLFLFNYQNKEDSISLSEIFPDQNKGKADTDNIEYEFVNEPKAKPAQPAPAKPTQPPVKQVQAPVAEEPQPVATAPSKPAAPALAQAPQPQAVSPKIAEKPKTIAFGKVNPYESQPESPVQVAKAKPAPQTTQSRPQTQAPAARKGAYTIQIASYLDRRSAEVALKGIQAAGQPAYIASKDLGGGKGTRYRIYIGQYDTKTQANEKLSEVKTKYPGSFVIAQ
jgi:cell division septation protein DedD